MCDSSFYGVNKLRLKRTQTSIGLLDSLESFLSNFQKDLTAVAGQISELQDRSQDIDNKLKSRRVRDC